MRNICQNAEKDSEVEETLDEAGSVVQVNIEEKPNALCRAKHSTQSIDVTVQVSPTSSCCWAYNKKEKERGAGIRHLCTLLFLLSGDSREALTTNLA
jgi:hypothetical protein